MAKRVDKEYISQQLHEAKQLECQAKYIRERLGLYIKYNCDHEWTMNYLYDGSSERYCKHCEYTP